MAILLAQPSVKDVRPVDPVLTNLSIGFRNERFLWDRIAPPASVLQKSGTYMIYTRDFWFRRQRGAVRAENGEYLRVGYGVTNATYSAIERGFEKALGDPERKASQTPEQLEMVDVAFLTNLLQLEMEKDIAAETFVSGKWGTDTTLAGANQWSDYASSDPIKDSDVASRTIRRNTGAKPNTLFVGALAWEKLKEHPLILDKYKHTQKGVMTPELVAAVLEIGELIVGDTVENTAAEGGTFAGADLWTDNVLFLVRNAPGLGVGNGAYTFIWDERGNVPWAIEQYRDERIRSEVSRIFTHYVPKVVSAQHGYLYLDAVA